MSDLCSDSTDSRLSVDQALHRIHRLTHPVCGVEKITVKKALGRILAETAISPINIPSERISSMDGYAFCSADIDDSRPFSLQQAGTSWAGKPYTGLLKSGQCIRIFTGAVVPDYADCVIMQEQVRVEKKQIIFPANCPVKKNIRQIGSDISKNYPFLAAKKKLTAVDCALLASTGIFEVVVYRQLHIAFFSTGDELIQVGQTLQRGQIYDSNRYALNGLLQSPCFAVDDMGVMADDKQQLERALLTAAKSHDVIITTGGASVGEADYIAEILTAWGSVDFWKIAIKPGKPLAFGKLGQCFFFGLPGNPVSTVVTLQKLVFPALDNLAGTSVKKNLQIMARCRNSIKKIPGRQEYQRGVLTQLDNGELVVETPGQQESHQLGILSQANCYIVLAADCNGISSGESVVVEPFSCWLD